MRRSHWLRRHAAITALASTVIALSAACSAPQQRATAPTAAPQQISASVERPLQFDPRVVTGTLKNGLRYYLLRHEPDKKRLQLGLVVKAGAVHEDEDQQGLAHFVEHMAFNGTRRFEKRSLVDLLERFGMSMGRDANAYTQIDRTQYWLTLPTELSTLVATALDVLEDWADGITFDAEEVEKERSVLLSEWLTGQGAARRVGEQTRKIVTAGSRFAERDVVGVIADLKRTGVPASYLDKMKAQRMRNLAQYFNTNELWLERFVEKYRMREDPSDIYVLYQLTQRLTSDNIRTAARHFLRDDQYVDARRPPAATAERSATTSSR